jgi:hypothetical protein
LARRYIERYLETLKENGGWREEDGWMVKRDMYGDVREVYKRSAINPF